jgi:hypothetical protein
MDSVSRPLRRVVPISLCEMPSQFYTVLRDYKRDTASAQPRFRLEAAALLHRFLQAHTTCITEAAGEWDALAIVPSTRRPEGPYPMEGVIRQSKYLTEMYEPLLTRGPAEMVGRIADDNLFATTQSVHGTRVLLIDDTFTTGARIQSAASRLQLDGADVVAAVAVGRIVHPDYSDESKALWDRARSQPFAFDVCCLE